ncbi:MAG: hypothetical protein A2X94_12115 [Bdellovibrionales bacterium GWB1_55_8]|nr:MAG: hypothetical protein A2X94_12115 [Bdellovibrionales bacterium GWB1_55_8]
MMRERLPHPERHEHSPAEIASRLEQAPRPSYLRDFVYGGIDGAITTFAIAAGAWGAQFSSRTVIILGLANLLADGFSMAASNYLGGKAEQDEVKRLKAVEERHVATVPQGEREEIRQIFARKGVKGPALGAVVGAITSDRERWIDTMLVEEYGVSPAPRSPRTSAAATFLAFVVCGTVPLLPFLFGNESPFFLAACFTGITFFVIGAGKSRWSPSPWWMSGLYTLAVGSIAAAVAFLVGHLLA